MGAHPSRAPAYFPGPLPLKYRSARPSTVRMLTFDRWRPEDADPNRPPRWARVPDGEAGHEGFPDPMPRPRMIEKFKQISAPFAGADLRREIIAR